MTAGGLREMQRDLESGRTVDPDRLRRAIEFAADVAEMAESREWDSDNHVKCVNAGRDVFDLAFSMHREAVP